MFPKFVYNENEISCFDYEIKISQLEQQLFNERLEFQQTNSKLTKELNDLESIMRKIKKFIEMCSQFSSPNRSSFKENDSIEQLNDELEKFRHILDQNRLFEGCPF
jgi:hypothetical protein